MVYNLLFIEIYLCLTLFFSKIFLENFFRPKIHAIFIISNDFYLTFFQINKNNKNLINKFFFKILKSLDYLLFLKKTDKLYYQPLILIFYFFNHKLLS